MKIAICYLSIGEEYRYRTRWSRLNKINYCKKHNYDFIEDDSVYDKNNNRGIPWSKVDLLLKYIDNYDYLVWMDADQLIMNDNIKLESIIEKYNNYYQIIGSDWIMPNTGCWFVKNNDWSKQFLNKVLENEYDKNKYPDGRWGNWEQGSVINLIDRNILDSMKYIKITYPNELNSYYYNFNKTDFIIHFAGVGGVHIVEHLIYKYYPYQLIDEDGKEHETRESYLERIKNIDSKN